MLALENTDLEFVDSVDRGLRLLDMVNSPWFQLYPDMGNLAAAGYDPAEQLRKAAGHLVAVHVKDTVAGVVRGVPFEEGIVPFGEVFQALAEIGFWGPLMVEMWSHMDESGDPLASIVAARQFVARQVAAAWRDEVAKD
jgi:L-ribulose-5-phosphate 3-epimerase